MRTYYQKLQQKIKCFYIIGISFGAIPVIGMIAVFILVFTNPALLNENQGKIMLGWPIGAICIGIVAASADEVNKYKAIKKTLCNQ